MTEDTMTRPATATMFELPNAHVLHRFTTRDGQAWACLAYDHGPFCRLCQPVDDVLDACLELTVDGLLNAEQDGEGQFSFRVTATGKDRVRHLLTREEDR